MKFFVWWSFFLVLVGSLYASEGAESAQSDLNIFYQELAQKIKGKELPFFLKIYLGDIRVNFYLLLEEDLEEEKVIQPYSLEVREGIVKGFYNHSLEEVDLEVHLSEEVVQKVRSSQEPFKELRKLREEKKINYTAKGFKNKFRFKFLDFFWRLTNLF